MRKFHVLALRVILFISIVLLFPVGAIAQSTRSGQGMTIWFDAGGAPGEPFSTIVQKGAEAAMNDLGCKINFMYSDWNPETMLVNFKKAVAATPDGIVVFGQPGDAAYGPLIDQAFAKGIVVTSIDTALPQTLGKHKPDGFGFIGTDYTTQGRALTQEALKRSGLKKGDRVFVWGLKRLPERGKRALAIIDVLEKAGMVVDYFEINQEVDKDSSLGIPVIAGYIGSNRDCRMMIVDHGALTSQMGNFLKAAGISPGAIYVAGFSLSPATATAIQNGYVSLVSEMQPYMLGYFSVVQIVMSKRYGFSGFEIDTGGGMIDKNNIIMVAPLAKQGIR
ncbi:MAG: substrate-binding domain-containing protein [Deltaproteobacteria bacterium]|nr:substrate-binding domain-containing protein [Deltaproteobacteria bacterium]